MNGESLLQLPDVLSVAQPHREARWLLGVDGGATKTLAAVYDTREHRVHLGHGGPSNEDAVGAAAAVQALLTAAEEAIAGAGIEAAELGAAVLAVAGTDTQDVTAHVRFARTESWIVVNDVIAAWASATDCGPGIAVIAGTGSNVFGVGSGEGEARAWRAGGWGHLLGDEGSGYWLGVQSLKAALRDRERSGPPTALSGAVGPFFGEANAEAVAHKVYGKPLSKGEIAAFAVQAGQLAEQGDAVARELYERGAGELAQQVKAVVEQTGLAETGKGFPVGLLGSAFKAGTVFVEPLERAILAFAPRARVSVVQIAPVGGSLLLAARVCGCEREIDSERLAASIEAALRG